MRNDNKGKSSHFRDVKGKYLHGLNNLFTQKENIIKSWKTEEITSAKVQWRRGLPPGQSSLCGRPCRIRVAMHEIHVNENQRGEEQSRAHNDTNAQTDKHTDTQAHRHTYTQTQRQRVHHTWEAQGLLYPPHMGSATAPISTTHGRRNGSYIHHTWEAQRLLYPPHMGSATAPYSS